MVSDPIDEVTAVLNEVLNGLSPPPARDPSTETWREAVGLERDRDLAAELARLRQTQRDLAASQADLTQVERELHDALRRAADLEQVREELRQKTLQHEGCIADYQQWESEKADLIDEKLALRADLSLTRAQLDDAIATFRAERERP